MSEDGKNCAMPLRAKACLAALLAGTLIALCGQLTIAEFCYGFAVGLGLASRFMKEEA